MTRSDFCFFQTHPEEAIEKLLTEFNTKLPEMNTRQIKELVDYLLLPFVKFEKELQRRAIFIEKKERAEARKQKREYKKRKSRKSKSFVEMVTAWECNLMHTYHQSLQEIRWRTLSYFLQAYLCMQDIVGIPLEDEEEEQPENKKLKKLLWDFYQ